MCSLTHTCKLRHVYAGRGQPVGVSSLFHHTSPRHQTQDARFGDKCLCPLNQLTGPLSTTFYQVTPTISSWVLHLMNVLGCRECITQSLRLELSSLASTESPGPCPYFAWCNVIWFKKTFTQGGQETGGLERKLLGRTESLDLRVGKESLKELYFCCVKLAWDS